MATPPNGNFPPSAEVRRVAFSDRGQDPIDLSSWRATASDALDSGLPGLDAPSTPALLHPQASRANFEQGIAVVWSARGETNDQMNQLLRPAALGIYLQY